MNVWIVNPYDNLPQEGTRVQRYWLLARTLVEAGHSVVYWTGDFSHAHKAKRMMSVQPSDVDAKIELRLMSVLPYPKNICLARLRSHRRLARDFRRMAMTEARDGRRPDLILASLPPLGLADAARRVASDCGARFVVDVQDAWPETFERILPRWVWTLLGWRRTARRIYRGADGVSAVAKRYLGLAQASGATAPMECFGHCIDMCDAGGIRSPGAKLRLVYAGNMSLSYDLETVLRAVAGRDDVTLDIAGEGPDRARLERRASDNVRFHGYLGESELMALLAHCDVGIVPMFPESQVGVPGKLADYAKAGIRVIESLGGECGEIVRRHSVGVHYPAGDEVGFSAALDTLRRADSAVPDFPGFRNAFDAAVVMKRFCGWIESLGQR